MSRVRDLSNHVMDNAIQVSIDHGRVCSVAESLQDFDFEIPTWDFAPFYPQSDDFEEVCLFYLLFNSINYCYFDEHNNRFQDGKYRSSTLAGLRITENLEDLKDPSFLANVDEAYFLGELFKAEVPLSLVPERVDAFREIGKFLLANPEFTFRKLFAKSKNNAYFISQVIPTLLPTWRDPFCKRAQLFVGMVYGRFQQESKPFFEGLEDLTVFADYRVPQTLYNMGILNYDTPLRNLIARGKLVPAGSRPEMEIRAGTIVATDLLTEELNKFSGNELNVLHTDYLLWNTTRMKDQLPDGILIRQADHHRTMTTYY